MDRSSHGVFVSKNQTKVPPPFQPRARETASPPLYFHSPQDCQPHPLVPTLAASTFTFGAISWGYLRFSIIKGNDNGCANISISLNLESMPVNLFDTIQTSRKIVYTSVFVTLTAFVDNVFSFNLEAQK
jgi:predicted permease